MRYFFYATPLALAAVMLVMEPSSLRARDNEPPATFFDNDAANEWRAKEDPVWRLLVEVKSGGNIVFSRRTSYEPDKDYNWPAPEYRAVWDGDFYQVYLVGERDPVCGSPVGVLEKDGSVDWKIESDEVVYYRPIDNRFYRVIHGAPVDAEKEFDSDPDSGWVRKDTDNDWWQYSRTRTFHKPIGTSTSIQEVHYQLCYGSAASTLYDELESVIVSDRRGSIFENAHLERRGPAGDVFLIQGTRSVHFGKIRVQRRGNAGKEYNQFCDGLTSTIADVAPVNENGVLGFKLTCDPDWQDELCDDDTMLGGGAEYEGIRECADCR